MEIGLQKFKIVKIQKLQDKCSIQINLVKSNTLYEMIYFGSFEEILKMHFSTFMMKRCQMLILKFNPSFYSSIPPLWIF